ncbi:MAG TPA: GNAT family N-acetyltransferase [Vicinamibacteria bacterium]|nr:GNAT family N-acetyltransferase [Vicinamibacteria bacterium]
MSEGPRLETARLVLRPLSDGDEEALFSQWNDHEVRRWLFDGEPVSREAVRAQIARSRTSFARDGFGLFTLAPRERPARLVGFAGLRRLGGEGEVELLYALLPAEWGRGLATEAAAAVLRVAFEQAGLAEVLAGADRENAASFRVMARLGMTFARDVSIDGRPLRYYRIARPEPT